MRRIDQLALGATIAVALYSRSAASQSCAAATDTAAMVLVAEMKALSGSTDAVDGYARRDLQLPAVDTGTIALVQQNQVCQKALAAFNSTIQGTSPLPSKIYVAKVGTVYVAMYPFADTHAWPYAVLDLKYNVLSKFAR
jgi:hypothetical protein